MMGTLKIEIQLPQREIEEFWRDAISMAKKELGVPLVRKEVIEIDGTLMAERELLIFSNLIAAIAVGDVLFQTDRLLNKE